MTKLDIHHIKLDRTHARAVCQGIGERLRDALETKWDSAPPKLGRLYDRLPELDAARATSIVPSRPEVF